jgi:hypothetical protein
MKRSAEHHQKKAKLLAAEHRAAMADALRLQTDRDGVCRCAFACESERACLQLNSRAPRTHARGHAFVLQGTRLADAAALRGAPEPMRPRYADKTAHICAGTDHAADACAIGSDSVHADYHCRNCRDCFPSCRSRFYSS